MRKVLLYVALFWITVLILCCCSKKDELIENQSLPKFNLEIIKNDSSKIILPVNQIAMNHFDGATYEIYSKTFNKKDKERDDANIENQFKDALKGLIKECITFTKIYQNEKDKNIDFGSYLRF